MKIATTTLKIGQLCRDKYYTRIIGISVLIIINSLCANYPQLSLLTGSIEILYLIYLLVCKSIPDFTVGSILLLSINIENSSFALGDRDSVLYSIFNLPGVRGYLLLAVMVAAMIKCFIIYRMQLPRITKNNEFNNFYIISLMIFFIGIFMTVISILINDNGMLFHSDMWSYIARDLYQMLYIVSIVSLLWYSLKYSLASIDRIKELSLDILTASTYSAVILILCGNYYNYWGSEYFITCPLILFFAPGLVLFLFEDHGVFHLITGVLAVLIQLRYTVGIAGTWWIYVIMVAILFVRKILAFGGRLKKTLLKMICIVGVTYALYFIFTSGILNTMQGQVTFKLSKILEVFNGSGTVMERLNNSSDSMSMRIEEIISAMLELIRKPWFLPLGKGYGGTVLQWGNSNWNVSGSTFSDVMIKYGTYSAFHIAIAEVIVNFGLIGIILIIKLLMEFVAEFVNKEGNSWILIGVLWFVFFYSLYYSFNLGLVWLCYGLYQKYGYTEDNLINENLIL